MLHGVNITYRKRNIQSNRLIGYTNPSVVYPLKYVIKNLILEFQELSGRVFMREETFRRAIRLRMLALVLALALTWYAINPAPGSPTPIRRDEGQPDEKRREARSLSGVNFDPVWTRTDASESPSDPFSSAFENLDDLEWPEVIDVR
jgi:hypothetical protein